MLFRSPQRLRLYLQGNDLLFEQQKSGQAAATAVYASEEAILPIPGTVQVPGTFWQARAEIVPEQRAIQIRQALQQENRAEIRRLLASVDQHSVFINGNALDSQILVRTRRPGDRIQPLGMSAEKKVKDILIDAHVPRAARASIPLFFSKSHCLWLSGSCLDQRARVTSTTRRIVRLSIEKQASPPSAF